MPAADPIERLLEGSYPDPEGGGPLRAETRSLVIEDRLDGAEADLVAALGAGPRVVVISDVDTSAAMGARVERALAARFTVQSIVLERRPQCDVETAARLIAAADPATDLVVAVGSGTLNDLAKLVAHRRGIPQVVFATAPSMNGYTSVSSSVLDGGVKRSVRTATPAGVFFDLRVIADAPLRLIRAGVGDSVCRSTAQADWLLAHLLLDRPYREAPFALLAADEDALLAAPEALIAGDVAAMRHLVRTLVLSGFGMTLCGGSYPASQGEHLLAHYVTMMRPHEVDGPLHGEEIGVCTLVMAALQDDVLARDRPPVVHASTVTRDEVLARFGPVAGETCWAELAPKLLDDERAAALNARLETRWPAIRARLEAVSIPGARLRAALTAVGAPVVPAELGWNDDEVVLARRHAREIRDRYTFLDLAADS
ncbi:MAG TPA: iron-containing alcohol dehydrogenase [Kofleriaceae bacterium]|nr:iron-containing alcohol dehydrogenase [Kofleriaceae bacterium]